MIEDLTIDNFRSFSSLRLNGLKRVNLIVGKNNSGKTSVLEAIDLLESGASPRSIAECLERRSEELHQNPKNTKRPDLDVCRLFLDYDVNSGSSFSITSNNSARNKKSISALITDSIDEYEKSEKTARHLFDENYDDSFLATKTLHITLEDYLDPDHALEGPRLHNYPLSELGGLSWNYLRHPQRRTDKITPNLLFLSTASLNSDDVVNILSNVILTPDEQLILRALQIIEPKIERIAPVTNFDARFSSNGPRRGGVVIKYKDEPHRIPIGTMGDGIWRMLSLALSLVQTQKGILLIDEIDTGLHYSVLKKMWRLVFDTAELLNVQVFATSHSHDCLRALADVCSETLIEDSVSVQRVEKDNHQSISYSAAEMVIASENDLEMR